MGKNINPDLFQVFLFFSKIKPGLFFSPCSASVQVSPKIRTEKKTRIFLKYRQSDIGRRRPKEADSLVCDASSVVAKCLSGRELCVWEPTSSSQVRLLLLLLLPLAPGSIARFQLM